MADTQLKAKISADTSALNSAVDASKAKINDLTRTAKATQATVGQMGGAASKVAGALTQMGGAAGGAGRSVAALGGLLSQAAAGPIGITLAAVTATIGAIKKLSDMLLAGGEAWRKYAEEMHQANSDAANAGVRDAGKAGGLIPTLQGLEGIAVAQERGALTPEQELQREQAMQALRRQDAVFAREFEGGFKGRGSSDALAAAIKRAQDMQVRNLRYAIRQYEADAEQYEGSEDQAKRDKAKTARKRIADLEAEIADLEQRDLAAELKARQALRHKAAAAAAKREEAAWAADAEAKVNNSPEAVRARKLAENEATFRRMLQAQGIAATNDYGAPNLGNADYARLDKIRRQQQQAIEADYLKAKTDEAKARREAANDLQTILDKEAALRKQRLDKLLAEQDKAADAWRSASDKLRGAEQSLADIQSDIAARKTQDRINALDVKLSGFGFALPGKRGKNARLDAGIAEKLARRAQGEDVDFSRRQRRRIRDYQRTARQRDRLAARQAAEAKRQQDASDRQRLEAARQQLQAAQAQQVAAQRQLQAADALLNAVGGRGAAQAESRRIATEAEAKAARQRENAKADAAQRAYDPNAKPRKTETIRQRRAREARERTAPGVPGAAAGGTGGGAELGVLRGIERGVDRLGDKVFVVV